MTKKDKKIVQSVTSMMSGVIYSECRMPSEKDGALGLLQLTCSGL